MGNITYATLTNWISKMSEGSVGIVFPLDVYCLESRQIVRCDTFLSIVNLVDSTDAIFDQEEIESFLKETPGASILTIKSKASSNLKFLKNFMLCPPEISITSPINDDHTDRFPDGSINRNVEGPLVVLYSLEDSKCYIFPSMASVLGIMPIQHRKQSVTDLYHGRRVEYKDYILPPPQFKNYYLYPKYLNDLNKHFSENMISSETFHYVNNSLKLRGIKQIRFIKEPKPLDDVHYAALMLVTIMNKYDMTTTTKTTPQKKQQVNHNNVNHNHNHHVNPVNVNHHVNQINQVNHHVNQVDHAVSMVDTHINMSQQMNMINRMNLMNNNRMSHLANQINSMNNQYHNNQYHNMSLINNNQMNNFARRFSNDVMILKNSKEHVNKKHRSNTDIC